MATIKKAYTEIVDFLRANTELTVGEVLAQVEAMASAKTGSGGGKPSKFHRDEDGNVVAIFCYYFKKWMDPAEVEFGKKSTSPTGYNNMCKEGVSNWTKQQRAAKAAEAALLDRLTAGEITVEDLPAEKAAIEEAKSQIVELQNGVGYETLEELLEARGQ